MGAAGVTTSIQVQPIPAMTSHRRSPAASIEGTITDFFSRKRKIARDGRLALKAGIAAL